MTLIPNQTKRQFSPTDILPFVDVPESEKPVELRSLEIQVVVMGLYAETTQTMRFYNPNNRVLEGNLTFPLPDNGVVCGYALDVAGQMVDGVVVPKQEARRILEAEERKGADPGIMEQVQGNVYRTRIYPIPANGSRTIKIVYVSDLTVQGSDAAYHLPLTHAGHIDKVDLRIEVVQAPVEPNVSGGPGNLTLNQWEDRWVGEATLGKGTPAEDLQVRLPRLPEYMVTIEKQADDQTFFSLSASQPAAETQAAWKPKRIALAWDASGSRTSIARDLDLLEGLFKTWRQLTVDIAVFRNRGIEETETFAFENGKAKKLLDYLNRLPYDGGTNLSALDLKSVPHKDVEAWFLFSDGMGTLERGLPETGETRVFTVTGQANNHSAFLQTVAETTGGMYINLLRTSPQDASRIITQTGEPIRLAEATGCEDISISGSNGRLTIIGRLTAARGEIKLTGSGAPAEALIIDSRKASAHRIIARAWAGMQARKSGLEDNAVARERLLRLGRKYGLVTPGTALLVLEGLEQYLEYDIEPPATLPDMRTKFYRHKAKLKKDKEKEQKRKIDTVLAWWKQRVEWWESDFKFDPRKVRPKPGESAISDEAEILGLAAESGPVAAAPMDEMRMSMAPPSPAAMADRSLDMAEEKEEDGGAPSAQASISIKPWSPDKPYLKAIKAVSPDQAYKIYLEQRREYATSPAFFLDCGDYFLTTDKKDLGLRILSNLVEMGLDDAALMRMYAWRLQQADEFDLAGSLLERVLADRDDEPQSHRDLALVLGERWQKTHQTDDALRAMNLLYDVILGEWDNFPEIEIIALMELNRLINFSGQQNVTTPERIDSRLIKLLDLDVRISMSWDTDMTDVDLHVFEPTGEHAYYGHNLTMIGGLVSRDFTQGYGPEEYVLKKAYPGKYIIKAHYYGSSQQTVSGACTVIVTVFTNYGRKDEVKQVLTLRLEQPSDDVVVGEITIEGSGNAQGISSTGIPDWQKKFKQLKRDMTVDEITTIVGQPTEVKGEEEMLLIYRPEPDVVIHIKMAPKLESVQQILKGAVLDLI